MTTDNPYVEERDGRYFVRGLRVQVTQIAQQWHDGLLPEAIAQNFDFLSPAKVYGALAFYLDQQEKLEQQRKADQAQFEAERNAQRLADPERYAEMDQRFAAYTAPNKAQAS